MPRPKGLPKTGGRVKGTGSFLQLRELLASRNIDVIRDYIEAFNQIEDAERRAELSLKLLEFIYPKPKEILLSPQEMLNMVEGFIATNDGNPTSKDSA